MHSSGTQTRIPAQASAVTRSSPTSIAVAMLRGTGAAERLTLIGHSQGAAVITRLALLRAAHLVHLGSCLNSQGRLRFAVQSTALASLVSRHTTSLSPDLITRSRGQVHSDMSRTCHMHTHMHMHTLLQARSWS